MGDVDFELVGDNVQSSEKKHGRGIPRGSKNKKREPVSLVIDGSADNGVITRTKRASMLGQELGLAYKGQRCVCCAGWRLKLGRVIRI